MSLDSHLLPHDGAASSKTHGIPSARISTCTGGRYFNVSRAGAERLHTHLEARPHFQHPKIARLIQKANEMKPSTVADFRNRSPWVDAFKVKHWVGGNFSGSVPGHQVVLGATGYVIPNVLIAIRLMGAIIASMRKDGPCS
jgi:hypothetical protein